MRRALHDADTPVDASSIERAEGGGRGQARELHRAARARPGAGDGRRSVGAIAPLAARRRCWCRRRSVRESPHALMAALAEKLERPAAGDQGIRGADRRRSHQRRGGAQAVDAGGGGRRRSARRRLRSTRVVALDPFDATAHTGWGRLALTAKRDADVATREFRAAIQTGAPDKAAAHCDLGESYLLAGRPRRRQEGSARRARDRAELRARAGAAAQRRREEVDDAGAGCGPHAARAPPRLAAATCAGGLAPRVARRRAGAADARRSRSALRRPAMDVRPRPLHRVDDAAAGRPQHVRRAVVHRRAGGRLEPLAPRAHRDRHPGQRSDRHHDRGSRALQPSRGSTSSRAATCG